MKLAGKWPLVCIWTKNESRAGHAALTTGKYYISFWPNKAVRSPADCVEACLHLNHILDVDSEEGEPNQIFTTYIATNDEVNVEYEKFLKSEGIEPELVTVQHSKEIIELQQLQKKRLDRQLKKVLKNLKKNMYKQFKNEHQLAATHKKKLIQELKKQKIKDPDTGEEKPEKLLKTLIILLQLQVAKLLKEPEGQQSEELKQQLIKLQFCKLSKNNTKHKNSLAGEQEEPKGQVTESQKDDLAQSLKGQQRVELKQLLNESKYQLTDEQEEQLLKDFNYCLVKALRRQLLTEIHDLNSVKLEELLSKELLRTR